MSALRIEGAHVVTWCVGALAPVWAAATCDAPFASLSFIAPPSILSRCLDLTGFQRHYLPMIMDLANGGCPDEQALYERVLRAGENWTITTQLDRDISRLTRMPLRDMIAMRRYAELLKFMCVRRPHAPNGRGTRAYADVMDEVSQRKPVLLLHCEDDEVVSYKCSLDIATRNPRVRLALHPSGAHFVLFRKPAMLAADISEFVRSQTGGGCKTVQPARVSPA